LLLLLTLFGHFPRCCPSPPLSLSFCLFPLLIIFFLKAGRFIHRFLFFFLSSFDMKTSQIFVYDLSSPPPRGFGRPFQILTSDPFQFRALRSFCHGTGVESAFFFSHSPCPPVPTRRFSDVGSLIYNPVLASILPRFPLFWPFFFGGFF